MLRGASRIDYRLVERMQAQGAGWNAIARACGVPVDTVRRACDPRYETPDLKSAAERTPRLASGRETRPTVWDPSAVEARAVPPCSNARTLKPEAPMSAQVIPIGMSPPPLSAGPRGPDAMAVARALVAAARALDEEPLEVFESSPQTLRRRRFRFAAFLALRDRYPQAGSAAIGRMTGVPAPHAHNASVAVGSKWWPKAGVRALQAAKRALEGGHD